MGITMAKEIIEKRKVFKITFFIGHSDRTFILTKENKGYRISQEFSERTEFVDGNMDTVIGWIKLHI